MMNLTIGFITFNNLKYTKLCLQSFKDTVRNPYKFFIVDGGSSDETVVWLDRQNIPHKVHEHNLGSCVGVNDLFDIALHNDDDYLLLCGNDVMAYPHAVDNMIQVAMETKADWVWAHEMRISDFCGIFNEFADPKYFDENYRLKGDNFLAYTRFMPNKEMSWHEFIPVRDYRNFCLISKKLFDKVGYTDVNFYPSGYFEDNDYCRRAYLKGCRAAMVNNAWFFHFWCRSLFEGGIDKTYEKYLRMNELYYFKKWGGQVGSEKFMIPFAEKQIKIGDRANENKAVEFWSAK